MKTTITTTNHLSLTQQTSTKLVSPINSTTFHTRFICKCTFKYIIKKQQIYCSSSHTNTSYVQSLLGSSQSTIFFCCIPTILCNIYSMATTNGVFKLHAMHPWPPSSNSKCALSATTHIRITPLRAPLYDSKCALPHTPSHTKNSSLPLTLPLLTLPYSSH